MRTITVNEKTFEEAVYPVEIEPSVFAKIRTIKGTARDSIRVTVSASYADVAAAFVNGAKWSITETVINEDGTEAFTVYDKSEYSVAGDIVDHRDGRISVYMAKPTESESLRASVETILPTLDDETALTVPELFPVWKIGVNYEVDDRINYNGSLYRVITAHTSSEEWTPDTAASLFDAITMTESGYEVWTQPTGAHDAYNTGDIVSYNDLIYKSLIDGNIYSPDAYPDGWELVNK